ncbi:hypothetical protein V8E51_001924 [Hyaloscypha variabilis]
MAASGGRTFSPPSAGRSPRYQGLDEEVFEDGAANLTPDAHLAKRKKNVPDSGAPCEQDPSSTWWSRTIEQCPRLPHKRSRCQDRKHFGSDIERYKFPAGNALLGPTAQGSRALNVNFPSSQSPSRSSLPDSSSPALPATAAPPPNFPSVGTAAGEAVRAEWQRAVSAAVLEPGLDLSVTARNGLLVTYSKKQDAKHQEISPTHGAGGCPELALN